MSADERYRRAVFGINVAKSGLSFRVYGELCDPSQASLLPRKLYAFPRHFIDCAQLEEILFPTLQ